MTLKRKRLVANIIFYSIIALIYTFIIIMVISKFNGGAIYLFNTRFDVVLTDSMSARNENHLDFLEGTTQIQPLDLVVSKKVDDNTQLKIKDVVLFKNPELNNQTTMHRIVEINTHYDVLEIYGAESKNIYNNKTIDLISYGSSIEMSAISLKTIDIEFVSSKEFQNNYAVNLSGMYYAFSCIESSKIDNYYKHSIRYESNISAARTIKIYKNTELDNYITKISFTTQLNKVFELNGEDYIPTESGSFSKNYNPIDSYRIRGDLAKDFDNNGNYFARSEIYSKVENVAPKLGYPVRFLMSIPGVILLVGLAFIVTFASYLYNRGNKTSKTRVIDNNSVKSNVNEKERKENVVNEEKND